MRVQVEINDIDLFKEYGLILTDREIGTAVPNLYQTTIPGRNGKLDYTEFYGDLTYQNRTIKMTFSKKVDKSTQELKYLIEREYNGKVLNVSFSDDNDHYWKGRATISSNDDDSETYRLEISLDAHPFKFLKQYDKEVR